MIPHFPNLPNLLSEVSSVFKEWVLGESPELDRINEIFREVEEMRLDLDDELNLASHVSPDAPEIAGDVIDVAATRLPIVQPRTTLPVEAGATLEWKKINSCLKKVERMQKTLDKLIEKFGKFPSNEQVDEVKALLEQLRSTQLLAGIRNDLSGLAVLTESEAIPSLERDSVQVLDEMAAITEEAEKLDEELQKVTPEREEDNAKIEKLRQSLSEVMDSGAKELERAVDADSGSQASAAQRLQTTLESYEKIKKEMKEKVTGIRGKFNDYQESIESRKRMEAAKKQFEAMKTRQADMSERKRPINKITPPKSQAEPAEKATKIAPEVSKVWQQKTEKDDKIVRQFVDFVLSEKENKTIEPKAIETEFKAWLKKNPGTLHPAVADSFFKAHSSKMINALEKKPKG